MKSGNESILVRPGIEKAKPLLELSMPTEVRILIFST
jgi:hypothetical protein